MVNLSTSYLSDLHNFRNLAKLMVQDYSIKVSKLSFIHYGQNTTYKITDTKGSNYLLRILKQSYHSDLAVKEELKWLNNLKSNGFCVPTPVQSKNRAFIVEHRVSKNDFSGKGVLFNWVNGRSLCNSLHDGHVYNLGALLGELQENTKRQKVKHRIYWQADDLIGENPRFGKLDNLKWATQKEQEIVNIGKQKILKRIRRFEQSNPNMMGLIHGDLHFGNFVVNKNQICPFDFDDCGHGSYLYDLAVPLSKLRNLSQCQRPIDYSRYAEALLEGHSSATGWVKKDYRMLPDYLMARRLMILGWLNERSYNPTFKPYFKRDIRSISKDLNN